MSNSLIAKTRLFVPKIWQQTVRHRGKYNFKMPKPRHDIARYLEEITKPVIIKELPDPVEKCLELKYNIAKNLKFSTNEAGDFEKFLANHAFNIIDKCEVMLICHKLDVSGETVRRNKIEFKKTDTQIWNFNTVVMKLMIENNPKYQNLKTIVDSGLGRNYYFFFKEEHLKKNLALMRKMPHFVLLGGMIHQCLYTRLGIQGYAKLEDIDTLRAQLCGTLNNLLATIPNTLSSPINSLSQSLDIYSKPKE